ncbi:hypothetical protein L5515_019659 [Caenorhabditis briggsae]|uniref:Uncharacterized protein n=1 Tax=Caenorhabditis briggsae TaxID=6238 RepID=A0AAE9FJT4_CAEBR|nr:hypothetical protein L5515_019659 [Caenorhabditis briggsae]
MKTTSQLSIFAEMKNFSWILKSVETFESNATGFGSVGNLIVGLLRTIPLNVPTTFKGIVLNRPTIKFPTDPNPVAFDSKVSTDFKIHEKFFISAKMDNWEVVFMRNEEVRDFTESIIQAMGQYGMAGQPPSHLH